MPGICNTQLLNETHRAAVQRPDQAAYTREVEQSWGGVDRPRSQLGGSKAGGGGAEALWVELRDE